jgi:predicted RNA-binding Zn-ribbon protein involved in translation (DUF1610 family)
MDGVFVLALAFAFVATMLGLLAYRGGSSPGQRRGGEHPAFAGRGHRPAFDRCWECGASLPNAEDAPWRLVETCPRCGALQGWASRPDRPAMKLEPWMPLERIEPRPPRLQTRTARGPDPALTAPAPPAEARLRPAPNAPPSVARQREAIPVDPFAPKQAADAREALGPSRIERRSHRPRPTGRGFRGDGARSRVPFARGRKGYNCCESCAAPLPREPEREWRFAGTCPRCGRVQIWAT